MGVTELRSFVKAMKALCRVADYDPPFEEVEKWTLFDSDRGKDSARELR
jgi:hypothetical protein